MKTLAWCVPPLLLLASATTAWANVAPVAYNTDPGFREAYVASKAAVPLLPIAIVLALLWLRQDPGRSNAIAVAVFLLVVAISAFYWLPEILSEGVRQPNLILRDEPAPANGAPLNYVHAPDKLREFTAAESFILAIMGTGVICFGTLAVCRRVSRLMEAPAMT
jgi:hypothetical protein